MTREMTPQESVLARGHSRWNPIMGLVMYSANKGRLVTAVCYLLTQANPVHVTHRKNVSTRGISGP
jgi:hypothetical protein